uniref:NB-ARC domain-containing protein n=1 Tax=Nymphaea colorata TaxID=210225 RepID=A0A5K0UZ73_9MAGN
MKVKGCNMLKTVTDMPALKRLSLRDLNTLKWLPSRLPLLEELEMDDLANWEEMDDLASRWIRGNNIYFYAMLKSGAF